MSSGDEILVAEAVVEVLHGRRPAAALATVIGRGGSAPQEVGAKLLYSGPGDFLGTVGGGAIEETVLEACRIVLKSGRPQTVRKDLMRDLGMCCGGFMEVFVERVQARRRVHLIGAGHVAQAVAQVALVAGFEVLVYDDRDELLEVEAFRGTRTHCAAPEELAARIGEGDARDAFLIMTHDHALDERALEAVVALPHAYVGMIGSRRKVHRVVQRLLRRCDERDRPRPELARVRAPIGLDLGGRSPGEIAVSVVAELVAVRHGRSAPSLSIMDEAVERLSEADEETGR